MDDFSYGYPWRHNPLGKTSSSIISTFVHCLIIKSCKTMHFLSWPLETRSLQHRTVVFDQNLTPTSRLYMIPPQMTHTYSSNDHVCTTPYLFVSATLTGHNQRIYPRSSHGTHFSSSTKLTNSLDRTPTHGRIRKETHWQWVNNLIFFLKKMTCKYWLRGTLQH